MGIRARSILLRLRLQERNSIGFPISKNVFEKQVAGLLIETESRVETSFVDPIGAALGINTETVTMYIPARKPITDEEVSDLYNILDSLRAETRRDSVILDIVIEELRSFFAYQKTIEECARIIQGRAQIYIGELS